MNVCYCCTNCSKKTNITRGVFGVLTGALAITTLILLGANLDHVNAPGSNLKLAEYQAEDAQQPHYDPDREGQLVQKLNGFIVHPTPGCSNYVHGPDGLATGAESVCKADSDDANDNKVEVWNAGWLVAPDCERSQTDPSECAPFSTQGAMAWFGKLTAMLLGLQTILFCVHTCVAILEQERELSESGNAEEEGFAQLLFKANNAVKLTLGLSITWCVIGFGLFVASYFAWEAFCDKIDTGLGRQADGHIACASVGCVQTFGGIFSQIIIALVWYRIPHILTWFGVLEAV